jgi:hypothetical protein
LLVRIGNSKCLHKIEICAPAAATSAQPRISASYFWTRNLNTKTETFMTGRQGQFLASTIAFGALGAGLVYLGRRANPGILAGIVTTAGYGLVTKAVSAAVFAALDPSEN